MLDVEAVGLGGILDLLVVVVSIVAYIIDLVHHVVKMNHLMKHYHSNLADRAIDVFRGDVDLAMRLVYVLLDFIDAAPAFITITPQIKAWPP